MKHWELEHAGELIRIEWNEVSTFNLQTPIGGQWVDYHCFTCYGIETDIQAIEQALVAVLSFPCIPFSDPEPTETRTEYCARMGHDM